MAMAGAADWILTAIALQVVTIRLVMKLAAKRFGGRPAPTAVPAE